MNDDPIEDALRRRPSDERLYEEPLRRLPGRAADEAEPLTALVPSLGVGAGHPTIRTRPPLTWLAALVLLAIVVGLVAALEGSALVANRNGTPTPSSQPSTVKFTPTGRVGCEGQEPGWARGATPLRKDCGVLAIPPAGYDPTTWMLDDTYLYYPDALELHVLVQDHACAQGFGSTWLIAQHERYDADHMWLTLAVPSPPPQVLPSGAVMGCPDSLSLRPFVVRLEQPIGQRDLLDEGPDPAALLAHQGKPFLPPSPTPQPASWHQPTDCSPDVNVAGFFKAASANLTFDVYCPVLPAGWRMLSSSDSPAEQYGVEIAYAGPAGQTLTLHEGFVCVLDKSRCEYSVSDGQVAFADRVGTLYEGPGSGDLFVVVNPEQVASWSVASKGLSREELERILAGLIVVAK